MDTMESLVAEWRAWIDGGFPMGKQWLQGLIAGDTKWVEPDRLALEHSIGAPTLVARTKAFIATERFGAELYKPLSNDAQYEAQKQAARDRERPRVIQAVDLPAVSSVPRGTVCIVDGAVYMRTETSWDYVDSKGAKEQRGGDCEITVSRSHHDPSTIMQAVGRVTRGDPPDENAVANLFKSINAVELILRNTARKHDMAIDAVEYARMLLSKIQPALDAVQQKVTESHRQHLDLATSEAARCDEPNRLMTDLQVEE